MKKNQPTKPNPSVAPVTASNLKPAIEVNDTTKGFWHRIVLGDAVGQWSGYQGIASLKVGDTVYYACTDYYHGSLPANKVFTTREV